MIGYTCKYTPVELLAALGGQPALLNREANAFSHAEALTHNHFCCHAKAVLEECRRDGVRELVLVNCCDSIRRCYDVLRAQGGLDFLFLLDLPHHDDGCAKARLRGELERLAAEYGAYRGATLDEAALRAAFAPPVPLPDGPFLAVTGARAGAGLLEALRRVSPLPVADLTCGGNRSLPPPPEGLDGLDGLLDWYTGALLGQIPCLRMDAVGRREELLNHPGLKGLVYHTVKFCDFYSFEYENLRRRTALPLLKVETDFTPLSSGQLSTRLEAFLEGLELRPALLPPPGGGPMWRASTAAPPPPTWWCSTGRGTWPPPHRPHRPKGQPGRGEGLRRPGRLHPGGHGRHRGHRLRPEQHPLRHRAGDRDHLPRPGGLPPLPGGPGHRGHRRPGQQGHLSGRVGRRDQLCDERQVRRRHRTVPGADGPHPGAEPGGDGPRRPALGAGADHLQHVHRLCRVGGGVPSSRTTTPPPTLSTA